MQNTTKMPLKVDIPPKDRYYYMEIPSREFPLCGFTSGNLPMYELAHTRKPWGKQAQPTTKGRKKKYKGKDTPWTANMNTGKAPKHIAATQHRIIIINTCIPIRKLATLEYAPRKINQLHKGPQLPRKHQEKIHPTVHILERKTPLGGEAEEHTHSIKYLEYARRKQNTKENPQKDPKWPEKLPRREKQKSAYTRKAQLRDKGYYATPTRKSQSKA